MSGLKGDLKAHPARRYGRLKPLQPHQRERVREIHEQIAGIRRFLNGPDNRDCCLDRPDFNPAFTELQELISRAEVWSEELVFLIDLEHEPVEGRWAP